MPDGVDCCVEPPRKLKLPSGRALGLPEAGGVAGFAAGGAAGGKIDGVERLPAPGGGAGCEGRGAASG